MTRTGKIARLPLAIRSQLNKQLADGVPGVRLVEWLNSLPEVQQLLSEQFDGREINEVNLTEWKGGGFLEWQARQDMLGSVQDMSEESAEIKAASPEALAGQLSVVLAARYAQLLNGWNGEVDEVFLKKLKGLRLLGQEIAVMRRGDLRADRLALQQQQYKEMNRTQELMALEHCVAESKKWPEVDEAFKKAFTLLLAYSKGKKQNWEYESQQRAKEEAEQKRRQAQEERRVQAARAETAERRRQWMEAHPGEEIDRGQEWMTWEIDRQKARDYGTGVRPPGDGGHSEMTNDESPSQKAQ